MKRSITALGVCILTVLFACAAFSAEYTADMVTTGPQGNTEGKLYVKGNLFRQDMTMEGQEQSIIINEETGKTLILMHAQKMYMELPDMTGDDAQETEKYNADSAEELLKANQDMATAEDLGKETINGIPCRIFKVTYKENLRGESTLWISRELKTPIKIITSTPMGDTTLEMKNIKQGGVSESLFSAPEDYKKMELPEM
jgi:outer membrane lipoprotein-sorting protein